MSSCHCRLSPAALVRQGTALLALKRYRQAVVALEQAQAVDPQHRQVRATLATARAALEAATAASRQGSSTAAGQATLAASVEAVVAPAAAPATPTNPPAVAPAAAVLTSEGLSRLLGIRTSGAAAAASSSAAGDVSPSPAAAGSMGATAGQHAQGSAFASRGSAAFRAGDYASACAFYTEALTQAPSDSARAVLLCNRSAAAHSLGQLADALADARCAAHLAPGRLKCWMRLGAVAAAARAWQEAAGAYQAALHVDPGQQEARERLALAVVAMGAADGGAGEEPGGAEERGEEAPASPEPLVRAPASCSGDSEDGGYNAPAMPPVLCDGAAMAAEELSVCALSEREQGDAEAFEEALAALQRHGAAMSCKVVALQRRVAQLEEELATAKAQMH